MHVSFGGCGFLLAFHVGVAKQLQKRGVLNASSRFAGASGGALLATALAYGISLDTVFDKLVDAADQARRHQFLADIVREQVDSVLPTTPLPSKNLVVTTAQIWPRVQECHLTRFTSREDLRDALLASCHIPFYLNGDFACRYRGAYYVDGGAFSLVPNMPDAIGVSPFPMDTRGISPSLLSAFPYSKLQLLHWALSPPSHAVLRELVEWGDLAAQSWHATTTLS
ncbi:hypothetical protein SPRG_19012 [Saprolegnia parasitica CBS 223.65]|uniref:PNPLA domain-containing protein n=1 Tax=Saprolegnia parasitica (strain CBS 223.65) TaxID=695850 RepID=A0A067CY37_SAPPC|nr:hypothetical protein SPRG_19012 [Saprolegnia parasitica CBS 223.65]KDO34160.1 hypothetical protein SPRG_19012 [Saprolegnia parasitica CBS 223.65]|eukprot:XP_012195211.1 hypothetical protein SPRG_19012 [Saprolegnia parasitica CBS 223.65]